MTSEEFNEFVDKCLQGIRIQSEMDVEALEKKFDEGYQKGLKDAWELARKLLFTEAKGGMSLADITECFGSEYDIARSLHMDVADAKSKYDAWKKKKDAVHVGDLIHTKRSDREMVVTGIVGSVPTYHAVDIRNGKGTLLLRGEFVTTGKHYDLPWLQDEEQNEINY